MPRSSLAHDDEERSQRPGPAAVERGEHRPGGGDKIGAEGDALRRVEARGDAPRGDQREGSGCASTAAVSRSAAAVGIPQSQNREANSLVPAAEHFHPCPAGSPAPATSMMVTPASKQPPGHICREMPAPISLTMTGTGRDRTSIAIPSRTPRKCGFPSGWRNS